MPPATDYRYLLEKPTKYDSEPRRTLKDKNNAQNNTRAYYSLDENREPGLASTSGPSGCRLHSGQEADIEVKSLVAKPQASLSYYGNDVRALVIQSLPRASGNASQRARLESRAIDVRPTAVKSCQMTVKNILAQKHTLRRLVNCL